VLNRDGEMGLMHGDGYGGGHDGDGVRVARPQRGVYSGGVTWGAAGGSAGERGAWVSRP